MEVFLSCFFLPCSRSILSDLAGKSPSGEAILPAVERVVESIRGVMETVGTPTPEHKTIGNGRGRQEEAAGVQKYVFTSSWPIFV